MPSSIDRFHAAFQFLSMRYFYFQADSSALAPVLCTLVASTTEFLWLHNFCNVLLNIGLHTAVRYADNRAFHFHTGIRRNPWTRLVLHLEFYGAPILLEDVLKRSFYEPFVR